MSKKPTPTSGMFTRGADKQDDGFKTKPEHTGPRPVTSGKLDPKIAKAFREANAKKAVTRRTKPIEADEVIGPGKGIEMDIDKETKEKVAIIIAEVSHDLGNAYLGKFHALKAGIGLTAIRGLFKRNEWKIFISQTFPARSYRTVLRYIEEAGDFLETNNLEADTFWKQITSCNKEKLLSSANQLMLGDGKTNVPVIPKRELVKEGVQMVEWILRDEDAKKPKKEKDEPRALTPEEEVAAAKARWEELSARVHDATAARVLSILDVEFLEIVRDELSASMETVKRAIASFQAKEKAKAKTSRGGK